MIDATDIRIGNYVWYYDYNMVETAFQVEGINEGFIYNTGLPQSKMAYAKAHPLILDLYLLRKFGFIAGDPEHGEDADMYSFKYNRLNSVHVKHDNDTFQPYTDSPIGMVPYGLPIVHVHQLQNWYQAVTRDELEILD